MPVAEGIQIAVTAQLKAGLRIAFGIELCGLNSIGSHKSHKGDIVILRQKKHITKPKAGQPAFRRQYFAAVL